MVQRENLPIYLSWLAHSPLDWLQFLGKPVIALLVPTGLAFWLFEGWLLAFGWFLESSNIGILQPPVHPWSLKHLRP